MDKTKLDTMMRSRRFWMAVAGVVVVFSDNFGWELDIDTVNNAVLIIGSWIVGDSLRKTE